MSGNIVSMAFNLASGTGSDYAEKGRDAVRLLSDVAGYGDAAAVILTVAIILLLILKIRWGRDPENQFKVEFYPPEGIDPLDAGYIIDGFIDEDDMIALIFHMAAKGYLDIREFPGSEGQREYSFRALEFPENESEGMKTFYRLFFDIPEGMTEIKDDEGQNISATLEEGGKRVEAGKRKLRKIVKRSFRGKKSFFSISSRGATFAGTMIFLAALLAIALLKEWGRSNTDTLSIFGSGYASQLQVVVAWFLEFMLPCMMVTCIPSLAALIRRIRYKNSGGKILGSVFIALIYIAASIWLIYIMCFGPNGFGNGGVTTLLIALIILAPFVIGSMRSRTRWNSSVNYRFSQFREFAENADTGKLKEIMDEDPSYFFLVLPYAYQFGITKKWARNFQDIDIDPPEWFISDMNYSSGNQFDVVTMSSMLNNLEAGFRKTMESDRTKQTK